MRAHPAKLGGIQAARGVAALLVALFHAHLTIRLPGYFGTAPFHGLFGFGHAGVEFFFVLSGFIIFHIHQPDLNNPGRLLQYLWKRINRIYPVFLVVLAFYTAKAVWLGEFQWPYFLRTIFFIPQPPFPMLSQSWTLVHEMLFYAIFGVCIANVRLGKTLIVLWMTTIVVITWGSPPVSDHPAFEVFTSSYNLLFVIGIAVAIVARTCPVPAPRILAIVGILCFVVTGLAENAHLLDGYPNEATVIFGVSSGLLILGLVRAEMSNLFRTGATADILGNLSYPLYLVHGAVLSIVIGLAKRFTPAAPPWSVLIGSVTVACACAYILHLLVERPIARSLTTLSRRYFASAGNPAQERPT